MPTPPGPSSDPTSFRSVLSSSKRVLALCGAGLSAASGLETFRGAGGLWKNHSAVALATPQAFERDPRLVWGFYSYRRHKALNVQPNAGHYALAQLARRMEGFVTLSQNVDGLHQRANHPQPQLKLLHGNLFNIKCFNSSCDYLEYNNFDDPIHPSLALDPESTSITPSPTNTIAARAALISAPTPTHSYASLPHCPKCKTWLLRPGVVLFGEELDQKILDEIEVWIEQDKIDLMLVIGTTAVVYPAAAYVERARQKGARIAVVNLEGAELGAAGGLGERDFLFVGEADKVLPEILGI